MRKALARTRYEKQYNKKAKVIAYRKGQLVYLHVPSLKWHCTKKLSKLWKGLYVILRVLSPLNVVLKVRRKEVTVHVNRIKPCLVRAKQPIQQAMVADDESSREGESSGEEQEVVVEPQGVSDQGPTGIDLENREPSSSRSDEVPVPEVPEPSGRGPTRVRRRPMYLQDYNE